MSATYHKTTPAEIRFWKLVAKLGTNDCWVLKNPRKGNGYWSFDETSGHRFSWVLHFGEIPNNLSVLHNCDNRPCVNPRHLFLGTAQDNVDDMWAKGRANPPRGLTNGIARVALESPEEMQGELNGNSRLTESQVKSIRSRYKRTSYRQSNTNSLAKEFGVCANTILLIVKGRLWPHV